MWLIYLAIKTHEPFKLRWLRHSHTEPRCCRHLSETGRPEGLITGPSVHRSFPLHKAQNATRPGTDSGSHCGQS